MDRQQMNRAAGIIAAMGIALSSGCRGPRLEPSEPTRLIASATAYCQSGITKSGQKTRAGVIAADPRVLPLGSTVRIDAPDDDHDGVYHVADTGSAVKGREVDIYMASCRRAKQFGRRTVVVQVLEWGEREGNVPVGTSGRSRVSSGRSRSD
jgi:3D (Asp-Asp-Asp) domain-containing protein